MESSCVVVPLQEGERARVYLLKRGLLRLDLKPFTQEGVLVLPTKHVESSLPSGWVVDRASFPQRPPKTLGHRDLLPSPVRSLVPRAFDVVGDIAILRLPLPLLNSRDPGAIRTLGKVGQAFLSAHPSIKVVAATPGVGGEYRVREIRLIGGEARTETVHQEYGMRLKLDVARVYFSPRLAQEHQRVASQVRANETVIDMFAGVGPFSILAAKRGAEVYAIEKNSVAAQYLRENVGLNRVHVTVIEGDAREQIRKLKGNRIIMNLPHHAQDYFYDALSSLKLPGVIHYYRICGDVPKERELIKRECERMGLLGVQVTPRVVGTFSPTKRRMSFDCLVKEEKERKGRKKIKRSSA